MPGNALPYYGVLILFGAARGFSGPAGSSLLLLFVPPEKLARSIALNSSGFTTAVIAGPALGGLLFLAGPVATYGLSHGRILLCALLIATLGGRRAEHVASTASRLERVIEGIRLCATGPSKLGAISLDLSAVLLGAGAVALLPVYARDILHAGPEGLGMLRSAPAVGAAVTALTLARKPIDRHTGPIMFGCVALFGVATIVFGLSTNFILSLIALFATGASDMVSVFVRTALVNFATPDAMRGTRWCSQYAVHRRFERTR